MKNDDHLVEHPDSMGGFAGTPGISRREALLTGGALALGGLALSVLGGCSDGTDTVPSAEEWDEEVDVVVVGAGSGVYTALRTNASGLKTLVLEKSDRPGGSTSFSSSVVWVPNNDVMKQAGYTDSREEALEYIAAGSADTYLPELAEAYVDTINTAATNITELAGVQWAMWAGGIDYRSSLPGGKEFGRSLVPRVETGATTAGVLELHLIDAATAAGIEIRTSTPAVELLTRTDDAGVREVIGVVADGANGRLRIKARVAVVMAAGGFDWNDDMMANYLRVPARHSWGVPEATGDAHKMAMRIGSDMRFMNEGWMSPGYKEEHEEAKAQGLSRLASAIRDYGRPGLIYVNKHGKRFTNECANYDSVGRSFCSIESGFEPRGWEHLPAYAIADQTAVDKYALAAGEPGKPGTCFKSYDSLTALAEALGINADELTATVARFNDNAAKGLDPDFGRGQDYFGQNYSGTDKDFEGPARTLRPLTTAPFWAAELVPVVLGTSGGIKTNAKSQALDTDGNVIARFYALGNCAGQGCGGAFYTGGGGTIGPALAFGELAAVDIANLQPWV